MKKVFLAHATSGDFRKNLYEPIRQSELSAFCELILPHETSDKQFDSKSFIESDCDLIIAEVSEPSIGLGIELGWANMYNKPVVCFYKVGSQVSESIRMVTNQIFEYSDGEDLIKKIKEVIK